MSKVSRNTVTKAIISLLEITDAKKATVFESENAVAKATRRHKFRKGQRMETVLVTVGAPNYEERAFIRACKKAGETFPVRKVQLKFFPNRKK